MPGVAAVTASYETPEDVQWGDGITAIDEKGKHDISLNAMPVDLDFTKTMKMQLLAGRDFQQSDFAMMDTSNDGKNFHQPYIINETLAKKIGWTPEQAIGKTISKGVTGPVVGVIKDFNFNSLHEPIGPLLIFLGRGYSRTFMLRVGGNDMKATLARLEAVWKDRVPDRPFNYHFLDDDYNRLYLAEQRTSLLFSVCGRTRHSSCMPGIIWSCCLYNCTTYERDRYKKSIGAKVGSITFLIAKNFLQLIGIAIVIAIPAAWWAGNKWLQDFAFRIPVQLYVFVITIFVTMLIAFCTVGYHSIKVALSNPVKSLKTE